MSDAYRNGRLAKDPADFWYDGELGFLDHYIIPLAMKLNDCGVFGVSSDEFLDYARANRQEWQLKGEQVVKDYVRRYNLSRNGPVRSCTTPTSPMNNRKGSVTNRNVNAVALLSAVTAIVEE